MSIKHILAVLFRKFERGYAVTVLFLASGAVLQGILRAGDEMNTGVWIYFVWGSAYMITVGLVIIRRRQVSQILKVLWREPLLLTLLLYASLSFLWASDPLLTARRVVIFGNTVLIGVFLAARFTLNQVFRLSGVALAIAGVLSVLVVVFFPEIGLYQDGRAIGIQGVFGNKNTLGRALSLGAAISFFLALDERNEDRKFWIGTFLLLAALVFLSQSKTSLVALVSVILLVPFLKLLRSPGKLLIPSLILIGGTICAAGLVIYTNWESLLALLGRDETLSSRLAIWYATIVMISGEPWLGHGYGADWLGEVSSYGYLVSQYFLEWSPRHAHNGILQVGFELGIGGILLFVGHFLRFTKKSIRWIRLRSRSYAAYLPMGFLITLLGANTTQTTIMSRNGIYWILYVAIALALSQSIRRERSEG
jgi:O-antigen ligase